jgi:amidohydrolase
MAVFQKDQLADVVAWRRDFHAHPELLFDVGRTAGIVAEKLRSFGCDEVLTGFGKTGVVAVIRGRTDTSGRVIGLRADMDALPIYEMTNLPHRSQVEGKMHACGHDGHSAMLLGAARHLAAERNFDGTAVLIFQPAEEGALGAKAMIEDGLFDRFGIEEVYGMHNMPGLPVGQFALRPGSAMSCCDRFEVVIEGEGGHAARPQRAVDPLIATNHVITALQTIVSRNTDPLESAVLSVCAIHGGEAFNVIPQSVEFKGTIRTLMPEVQDMCETRFHQIVNSVAEGFGCTARITYSRDCPITRNDPEKTVLAGDAAAAVAGEDKVTRDLPPSLGSEDFSFMLEKRPGAMIFLGNGDTANIHHPMYDFNDEAIPFGVGYWTELVERRMPAAA